MLVGEVELATDGGEQPKHSNVAVDQPLGAIRSDKTM